MTANPLVSGTNTPTDPQWFGIYTAIVANTNDPLTQGRVQLQVPQVLGNAVSNWAIAMQPGIIPAVGTQCLCIFIGGNPNMPQYFLGLTNEVVQSIQSSSNVLNINPVFLGAVLAPWMGQGCTLAVIQPNSDTNPPFENACLMTATSNNPMYIQDAYFDFAVGTTIVPFEVSAWVYSPGSAQVFAGFLFEDTNGNIIGTDFSYTQTTTVPSGQWTYITAIVNSPVISVGSTQALPIQAATPIVGILDPITGQLLEVEAVFVIGQIPGSLIAPATVGTDQINFTSPEIGGIQVFIQETEPVAANLNDIWFDVSSGNGMFQWNGSSWIPFQWGSSSLQAGSVIAGLVAAGAIDGMTINGIVINGNTINAADVIISATNGGIFTYAGAPPTVQTLTSGTTWKAPAGVTSVQVECVAGGGGGGAGSGGDDGGGGGGGEYAIEPTVAVTAGSNYTYAVGAGGAAHSAGSNTTFTGNSVTVTAHGGSAGSGATGGAGGTGSTNSAHHNGGAGAAGSTGTTSGSVSHGSGTFNWTAPTGVTKATAGCFGGGGGGGGGHYTYYGGPDAPGAGGGGGGFAYGTVAVTPGDVYTIAVGSGGSGGTYGTGGNGGGNTTFAGDSGTVEAGGGYPGGGGNGGGTVLGGDGGFGILSGTVSNTDLEYGGNGGNSPTTVPDGAGGGGCAGLDHYGYGGATGNGSTGGAGGSGGGSGSYIGGNGGTGGSGGAGGGGGSGGAGGGGGGGEGWSGGISTIGAGGAGGYCLLTWGGTSYQAGGGGGSGGSASAGLPGGTESGAGSITGGGPGGGTLSGGVWTATGGTPGGGGGGIDPAGAAGAGGQGRITLTYSSGSPTLLFSVCGAQQDDPITNVLCPEGPCVFQGQQMQFNDTTNVYQSSINGTVGALAIELASTLSGTMPISQTDLTTYSITGTAVSQASKRWIIPPNDAQVGTTYRLTVLGDQLTSGTAQGSGYFVGYGTAGTTNQSIVGIGSGTLNTSEDYAVRAVIEMVIQTTGTGGTAIISGLVYIGELTTYSISFTWNSISYSTAINTTVNQELCLNFQWNTNTGGPVWTGKASIFERLGP